MTFLVKADRHTFHFKYLASMAGPLGLSIKEVEVLACVMKNAEEGHITKESRKRSASELGVTSFNLNNYISKFKKKGMITKYNSFAKNLMPDMKDNVHKVTYEIRIS